MSNGDNKIKISKGDQCPKNVVKLKILFGFFLGGLQITFESRVSKMAQPVKALVAKSEFDALIHLEESKNQFLTAVSDHHTLAIAQR